MPINISRAAAAALACTLLCATSHPSIGHAHAKAISAEDIARLVDLDALAVSPDGQWAAYQTRQADPHANTYAQSWRIASTAGDTERRLADAGDPILARATGMTIGDILTAPPAWSPDSRWIVYPLKKDGHTQLWRSGVDGITEQLTHGANDVRAAVFSADGTRVLFETEPSSADADRALNEEARVGFLYDNRFIPMYGLGPVLPADTEFATGKVVHETAAQAAQKRMFALDLQMRKVRPASAADRKEFEARTSPPKLNPGIQLYYRSAASTGGTIAWTEPLDEKRQGGIPPMTVVVQPPGAEERIICTAPQCTSPYIGGLWWWGENEVLFAARVDDGSGDRALYAWRVGDATVRQLFRTADHFVTIGEWACSIANNRLVCFYEETTRPRRLVAIALDGTGRVDTLYDPNPSFARFDLGAKPRHLTFRSASGVETSGYLVLPPKRRGRGKLPLVVVTYACPGFLRGGTGDEYPIYPLAAEGNAVLCFNAPTSDTARLDTMDFKTYQIWGRGPGDPISRRVQDALATAVSSLDQMGIIDVGRIGIAGLSSGSEVVHYALFQKPTFTAAIVSGPTGFEPANTFLMGPAARRVMQAWGLGSPASERWKDLALSSNVDKVQAALLLNVPDHEMISALKPVAALEGSGRAVEMYVFPDEYHIKWQPAHRLAIYNRNIDWMNFWLLGREDPAPAKAEQYKRWRAMRVKQCELFRGDDAPWYCPN